MDFLKYGMKYKNSSSKMQRLVAKYILEIEKRKADHYEARLNKKQIVISQTPEEVAALFQSIRNEIAREHPAEERIGESPADHDAVSG